MQSLLNPSLILRQASTSIVGVISILSIPLYSSTVFLLWRSRRLPRTKAYERNKIGFCDSTDKDSAPARMNVIPSINQKNQLPCKTRMTWFGEDVAVGGHGRMIAWTFLRCLSANGLTMMPLGQNFAFEAVVYVPGEGSILNETKDSSLRLVDGATSCLTLTGLISFDDIYCIFSSSDVAGATRETYNIFGNFSGRGGIFSQDIPHDAVSEHVH